MVNVSPRHRKRERELDSVQECWVIEVTAEDRVEVLEDDRFCNAEYRLGSLFGEICVFVVSFNPVKHLPSRQLQDLPRLSRVLSFEDSPNSVSKRPYADAGAKADQGTSVWADVSPASLINACEGFRLLCKACLIACERAKRLLSRSFASAGLWREMNWNLLPAENVNFQRRWATVHSQREGGRTRIFWGEGIAWHHGTKVSSTISMTAALERSEVGFFLERGEVTFFLNGRLGVGLLYRSQVTGLN